MLTIQHTNNTHTVEQQWEFYSALTLIIDIQGRPTFCTPPCPPPTRCAGGPTRAVACEAGYFFRVVVVASSSVVRRLGRSGTTPNATTSRKSGARPRA